MSAERKRVAVLISGRGSNLAALIAAAREKDYPAEIVGIVSDNPEAAGLKLSAPNGIAARVVERKDFADKAGHDAAIDATLRELGVEVVALAGYMRLLTPEFVGKWSGRMVNIHPALLPSFKGLDTHRKAIEAGVRIHGCTVHFVTAAMDDGPVIAQAAVPVLAGDTEDALAARVLKAEHKLYPTALSLVCRGKAKMEGGRTVYALAGSAQPNAGQHIMAPEFEDDARSIEDLARFTP